MELSTIVNQQPDFGGKGKMTVMVIIFICQMLSLPRGDYSVLRNTFSIETMLQQRSILTTKLQKDESFDEFFCFVFTFPLDALCDHTTA